MLTTRERRAAIRTLRGWAIAVLSEAHAIQECEEHGWMQHRADPHARERAFAIARQDPPSADLVADDHHQSVSKCRFVASRSGRTASPANVKITFVSENISFVICHGGGGWPYSLSIIVLDRSRARLD